MEPRARTGLLMKLVVLVGKPLDAARLEIVLVVICCDVFAAIGGEKPRAAVAEGDDAACAMCIILSRRMIIDGRRRWNFVVCCQYTQLLARSLKPPNTCTVPQFGEPRKEVGGSDDLHCSKLSRGSVPASHSRTSVVLSPIPAEHQRYNPYSRY